MGCMLRRQFPRGLISPFNTLGLLLSVQTGAIALVSWLMLFLFFCLSFIYGSYTFGGSHDLAKTLLPTLMI
jgi:hypothetical protein